MIRLYCRKRLHSDTLPQEYADLLAYARRRLTYCRFGDNKTSCKRSPVHCYAPQQREMIRKVMRWCGPRMLIYHPIITLRHYIE